MKTKATAILSPVVILLWLIPSLAVAQESVGLPGGASSLRETHGDWTVGCAVQSEGRPPNKVCFLAQEQVDGRSRQRLLAVEIRPVSQGPVTATFVLPFGLKLQNGLTLQVDEAEAGDVKAFRTCLPVGCLVDVSFDEVMLKALRGGKQLKVNAVADDGGQTAFAISLKGFQGAYKRTLELTDSR